MHTISELFIYPVKSLSGITVSSAIVTERGLQHDRRWMLIDDDNVFISQREFPSFALLQTHITNDGVLVEHKKIISTLPFLFSRKQILLLMS